MLSALNGLWRREFPLATREALRAWSCIYLARAGTLRRVVVLDVDLDGERSWPIADVLVGRNVPFEPEAVGVYRSVITIAAS